MLGTIEDVVDELRERMSASGPSGLASFRPYPLEEVRAALANARRVVVLEKAFSVGAGGIVGQNVRDALAGSVPDVYDVVGGLGGRPITKASLHRLVYDVLEERLEPARLHFLDLNADLVEREPRAHERRAALRAARGEHPARPRRRRSGVAPRRLT